MDTHFTKSILTKEQQLQKIRQKSGTEGERIAKEYLVKLGYLILKTNEHTHWGEIDMIARTPEQTICFVEVRAKSGTRWGTPEESFNYRKQLKVKRAVEWYALKHSIAKYQVDLVAIEYAPEGTKVRHYKNVSLV